MYSENSRCDFLIQLYLSCPYALLSCASLYTADADAYVDADTGDDGMSSLLEEFKSIKALVRPTRRMHLQTATTTTTTTTNCQCPQSTDRHHHHHHHHRLSKVLI
uniref:Uncharacterized protein n=1 Tax=Glossina austeni TaxID=7395 RepID=A0A1A9UIW8_GLOAU